MAEIQNRYLLNIELPINYTLTGNNRNASITATADSVLMISTTNKPFQSGSGDCLKFDYNITIKRARIYAAGGYGIQPAISNGELAGKLLLNVSQLYDGSGPNLYPFMLCFPKWEEWIEINNNLKPYEGTPGTWTGTHADKHPCCLKFQIGSSFSFDDYNIQADYVGETITPMLELEVYTAGIIDMQHGIIY